MSDITSTKAKISVESTRVLSAMSEFLWQRLGGSINYLIDRDDQTRTGTIQSFTSNGNYTVPANCYRVYVLAVGGGAGGSTTTEGAAIAEQPGNAGGDTTFGSYVTAKGGLPGMGGNNRPGNYAGDGEHSYGAGGTGGLIDGSDHAGTAAAANTGGGGGGAATADIPDGWRGGGGGRIVGKMVAVTPAQVIAVAIGVGGAGGVSAGYADGGDGGSGICIVSPL